MKLEPLLELRRYGGEPLESGGTSIKGSAAPAIRALAGKGAFEGATVLDYGAGKYARNTNYLREMGLKVYAYDPFNGVSGADGWTETTTAPPTEKFDVGFTSFVLNVVPEHIEKKIVQDVRKLCKNSYHITRNMDIFKMVKNALGRKDKTVTAFFLNSFADEEEKAAFQEGTLTDETIMEFCEHGVQTNKGFQRIPTLEDQGFRLTRKTEGFKVYEG